MLRVPLPLRAHIRSKSAHKPGITEITAVKPKQAGPLSALTAIMRPSLTGRKILRGQSPGAATLLPIPDWEKTALMCPSGTMRT